MDQIKNVVFCFDENYQQHAAAAAMSVIANFEAGCENLCLHFVTEVPTEKFSSYVRSIERIYRCKVYIYDIEMYNDVINKFLSGPKVDFRYWTKATLFRLLLPSILPNELDKILYLDSDVIALQDVSKLFEIDIGDAMTGAVLDPNEEQGRQQVGTKHYYNAGVLIMKLDLWRKHDISSKCFEYLLDPSTSKTCLDQDAINVVLQDRIFELPKQWNTQITNGSHSSDSFFAAIHDHAYILHFITANKPWHRWYKSRFGEFYWHYLFSSPWKGITVEEPKTVNQYRLMAIKHSEKGNLKEALAIYEKVVEHFLSKS
jgi:UDP-glucose/galactose:(glucosyl)LPS alpha-1,2-glucosyl/galactosyltransferase